MSRDDDLRRMQTGDLELGVTEATQQHVSRRVARAPPASPARLAWERKRPQWLREMIAEALGVAMYVMPGVAATAAQITAIFQQSLESTAPPAATIGSVLSVGFAFGFGIAFAIIVGAPVSGGHFNPAITLSFVIFQGFPVRKAARYLLAQICGAIISGLLVYAFYKDTFDLLIAGGIPGTDFIQVFCAYPKEYQSLGFLFVQEFFVDAFIGFVIWAVLDPANPFVSPSAAPFIIGLAYTACVAGTGSNTLSTNLARDLGTRIVAAGFFGKSAFTYRKYSPIGILVNIPATLFAVSFYEFVFKDTIVAIKDGHMSHPDGLTEKDVEYELKRRESSASQATFAGTRLGRFLSNRHDEQNASADDRRVEFADHAA